MPTSTKKKVNLSFRGKKTVVLEEPKPTKKEKVTAKKTVPVVVAPKVPEARPVKMKKEKASSQVVQQAPVVAVAVRPLASGKLQSLLQSICDRATTGEFRGRKEKPPVVLTMGEMQALTQCLTDCQTRNAPTAPVEKVTTSKSKRRSKVA